MSLAVQTAFAPQADLNERRGRSFVSGDECQFGERVRPDDLVLANFDRRSIHTGGALYLVRSLHDGWRGCRWLMMITLNGGIEVDDGHADVIVLEGLHQLPWEIVATVEEVYRPTLKKGGRA